MSTVDDKIQRLMYEAVSGGKVVAAKKLLDDYPDLRETGGLKATWLHDAATFGNLEMVKMFIESGVTVDKTGKTALDGALDWAVMKGHIDVARLLLERGAVPVAGRILIGAINAKKNSFELVKLLVEHGADVNQWWHFGDEESGAIYNALSWAVDGERQDIVDYLQAHGAVMPPAQPARTPVDRHTEVVRAFEDFFGAADPAALREIVPSSDNSILIHRIPPNDQCDSLVLFTSGMSQRAMNVPPGAEEYAHAELFIELPSDWKLSQKALSDENNRWPIDWLRKIAAYPFDEQTWLGGPFAIVANGDPPAPLASKCPFAAMLIVANLEDVGPIIASNGEVIQIYTLMPIYESEMKLERNQDLSELFRRFDQFEVTRKVNLGRPNVASRSRK